MGTTKTALQAGSTQYRWVLGIEAFSHLITDGDPAAALAAWSGLDWSSAIDGLYVEATFGQAINPWDPFTSGGSMTFRVVPDTADTFGIEYFKRNGGSETRLTAALDVADSAADVQSTSAFASSGLVYIGTEAVGYGGKSSTQLTSLTRGKFAPLAAGSESGSRRAQNHRISTDENSVRRQPRVTSDPRNWTGRWVALHRHRDVGGTLDSRAQSERVFAGRIVRTVDDASNATVVQCEHVLDVIKRTTIGKDTWSAKIREGVFLPRGTLFYFTHTDATTSYSATPMEVVAPGTASASYEINEGQYSTRGIVANLNGWLAAEQAAGRITGSFVFDITPSSRVGLRTVLTWKIPGSGDEHVFYLDYPPVVAKLLGGFNEVLTGGPSGDSYARLLRRDTTGIVHHELSTGSPLSSVVDPQFQTQFAVRVDDERGVFVDQTGDLPPPTLLNFAVNTAPDGAGLFLINGATCIYAARDGDVLFNIETAPIQFSGAVPLRELFSAGTLERPLDDEAGPITIQQVLVVQNTLANVFARVLASTGDSGYNGSFDNLPAPLGAAIPWSVLGDAFEDSLAALPAGNAQFLLLVHEPTMLEEIFKPALVTQLAFLRWKDGFVQLGSWDTPTTSAVILDEDNKAAPVDTEDDHRAPTVESDEWQRTSIKIDYDRDITSVTTDGGYRSSLTIVDPVAEDDAGGDPRPVTLKLQGAYGVRSIDAIKESFAARVAQFTQPILKTTRTIDSRYFEGLSVGDTVLLTDPFARDPDTGRRGLQVRPAIVLRHQCNYGGAAPGTDEPTSAGGEVDLMVQGSLRVAAYVPSADISSYNAGTKVLTCDANAYSESGEAADASYFSTGRKVRVLERDPANSASPLSWDDVVASQSGNTITLTTGLTSPTYDPAKDYRIVFDDYADATAVQQTFCYLADDADGMIANLRVPFDYAGIAGATLFTANDFDDAVELPPDVSYAEGSGLDVGHEAALNRLVNNLLDLKTAISAPYVQQTEMSGAGIGGGASWTLLDVRRINLTADRISSSGGVARSLLVAPYFKSSDGASAQIRLTLARLRPTGTSLDDVGRGLLYADATFTTTSTTYSTPSASSLAIRGIPDPNRGECYLLIEGTAKARTRGLGICQEGPRE